MRPRPRPALGQRPSPGRLWKGGRRHPVIPDHDQGPAPTSAIHDPDRGPTPTSVIPDHDRGSTGLGVPLFARPYHMQRAGLSIIQPTAEKRTGNVWKRSRSAFGKSPAMGEDAYWRPPSVSSGEVESDDRNYIVPADQVVEVMANGRYDLVPLYYAVVVGVVTIAQLSQV